ncbi:MAG: hypothetical protein NTY92_05755 [Nitrosospira sp.]|nr:hypothetical protein [Nitrosospira sp.]
MLKGEPNAPPYTHRQRQDAGRLPLRAGSSGWSRLRHPEFRGRITSASWRDSSDTAHGQRGCTPTVQVA